MNIMEHNVSGRNNYEDGEVEPTSTRFKYRPFKRKPRLKKFVLIIIAIVVIIVLMTFLWWWPSWFADINLQTQLYDIKAGGIDFQEIYFLDFWSISFFFNWTALIGGFIGAIIMSIPPERTLLTVIGTRARFGKPSIIKSLLFWWTIGFFIFYLLGFLLALNDGQFSWTIYLIQSGEIELSPFIVFDAFDVLFDPNNTDYITIFTYTNLILPIIYFIFALLIIRAILSIVKNSYLRKNDYYVLANIFMLIGLFFGIGFFSLPQLPLDGIGVIQVWSVLLGFIGFLTLGLLIYIYGRRRYTRDSKDYALMRSARKKILIVTVIVIIVVVSPLIVSLGPFITLNNADVWLENQWVRKYNREVTWTKEVAGLNAFEERDIQNYTQSRSASDAQIVSVVRQFDQNFAVPFLAAQIGTTWEGLADSDIIYIGGREYWVAPKTIKIRYIEGSASRTNTELYDHVEGFLALDTFSGNMVNITTNFNITNDYPFFFGERESKLYLQQTQGFSEGIDTAGAFDEDILLDTGYGQNRSFVNNEYEGEPDGRLQGLENFWKKINIGLFAYVFDPIDGFLINRNVKTRVESILYPGLTIDSDPYLVFDMALGKVYYAVSIFTSINVGSYARTPILRFLGVCLIDVLDGSMRMYKNPNLDETDDPTLPLWNFYLREETYPWQPEVPDWLKVQIRYPEDLFEAQLEANYIYHVDDPSTWKRGDDFQERPSGGNTYYVETDLGATQGIEYVGMDLVKYIGETATVLAGMYVVRHGDNLGDIIFYNTRSLVGTNLIGSSIANQTYTAEATQEISLIANARNGNILLYPLGNAIYYYIPTYSTVGDQQQLKLAGFVHVFTRQVGYGPTALEAYAALNITETEIPSNLTLTYDFEMDTSARYPDDPANFQITLQNTNLNFSAPGLDVKVNLTVFTSTALGVDYNLILPPNLYPVENHSYVNGLYTNVNFTVIDTTLFFGEGLTINGYLNVSIGNIIVYYMWTLIVNDVVVYVSPESLIQFLG